MTIAAVQQELHIRERYLEALENDDFDQFPGVVYARGFLRSYARYLDLDAEALLGRLPKPPEPPQPTPDESQEPPRRREPRPITVGRSGSQWPWVVIPLIFLVALLYFVGSHPGLFGSGQNHPSPPVTAPNQTSKKHHKTKPKPATQPTQPTAALTPAPATQGPYGGPQANYTVPAGPLTVSLQLTAPCYVYVDLDNAPSAQSNAVQPAGTLQYTAQQSFVIKLGVPSVATLTVDGQVIPLQGTQAQSVGISVQGGQPTQQQTTPTNTQTNTQGG